MKSEQGAILKLNELALLWLNSQQLHEKLLWSDHFTDQINDQPLPWSDQSANPGRPRNLVPVDKESRRKVSFPPLKHIEQKNIRGQMLHFFANHELFQDLSQSLQNPLFRIEVVLAVPKRSLIEF